MDQDPNFKCAKNLLMGALDTVLEIAQQGAGSSSGAMAVDNAPIFSPPNDLSAGRSQVAPRRFERPSSSTLISDNTVHEHKRLFGFKPSKAVRNIKGGKGKGKGKACLNQSRAKVTTWKRECICLCECQQTWKPSPEDRMKLAKMGLGLKEIIFNSNGDEDHVHDALLSTFPALRKCGGYTLLRLGGGSKSLIEIEGPDTGLTVPYLKDILNQAKLYVRPLQCDISEDDVQEECADSSRFSNEPMEFCLKCNALLHLSQLRKHIVECGVLSSNSEDSEEESFQKSRVMKRSASAKPTLQYKKHCSQPPADVLRTEFIKNERIRSPSPPIRSPSPVRSPSPPIPEPISPILKQRSFGTTTYGSFINLISDDESDWERDPAVQEILVETSPDANRENQQLTLDTVLHRHVSEVLRSADLNKHRITVRRGHLFEDTKKSLVTFDETKHIRVTFLGEPAVDDGGPRREFFMLLIGEIANNGSLLDGPPDRRVLRHNVVAFKDDLYLFVGKIIALSILNGGPGPTFFARAVVDYIFEGVSGVQPRVEDISDEDIQQQVSKLENSQNEDEFHTLLSNAAFRFNCGICQPVTKIKFSEKMAIISAMSLHYSIFESLAELEQLRRGLNIQKFSTLLEKYPDMLRTVFAPSETKVTSDLIQDMFEPLFSPKGSNQRSTEEALIMLWIQYVQHLEGPNVAGTPTL